MIDETPLPDDVCVVMMSDPLATEAEIALALATGVAPGAVVRALAQEILKSREVRRLTADLLEGMDEDFRALQAALVSTDTGAEGLELLDLKGVAATLRQVMPESLTTPGE